MLEKVLKAPITVAIGELWAVSKEVSTQVQEVIKYKSAKASAGLKGEAGYETAADVRLAESPHADDEVPSPSRPPQSLHRGHESSSSN